MSLLLAGPTPSARAMASDGPDPLDALVQATLDGVAPAAAPDAVRWILDAHFGTTGFHAVSPASIFQEFSSDENLLLETTGSVRAAGLQPDSCGYAPVHLPQGATVTALVLWVRDFNPSNDTFAELPRKANGSVSDSTTLASVLSSGSATGARVFTDFTVTSPVVDNTAYSYYVGVCLPNYFTGAGPTELRGIYLGYTF